MATTSGASLWTDTLPVDERFVAPTPGVWPDQVDVAIVGGGYTGLWTAWYLARRDPSLRVIVVEREQVGFGASGRNGGWCSALLPMGLGAIADRAGAGAATRMQTAMHDTVTEVESFAAAHAPGGVFVRGGTFDVARGTPQLARLRDELDEYRRFGFGDDDYRWLDRDEADTIGRIAGTQAAVYTPHCGTVHPLRLVHSLARAVAGTGVTILEGTAVTGVESGAITTDAGRIRADVVIRATEGYTCELPGERRTMLPIYSLMVATEPLPDPVWSQIGLADRPTFADRRNMIIYGQRTADDRFAFGGRGAPYHFGSRIRPEFDRDDRIRSLLTDELRALFPAIGDAAVSHHWGGVLGVPRDWTCSVRYDRTTGFGAAGGYVGDGVATTNLAGRTLATLIVGPEVDGDEELVRLPWVGHRSRRWEPEPLRWLGVNAGRLAARRADDHEARHDRPSGLWGGIVSALLGH
jgi:glycine/D-amino acid oxidase-like deaminating enzyme